ncbi:MAG: hypothetical protein EA396_10530 [Anaerolineaceae bacterium]|nr:MAG: hypothetical protein EA396_10530 [Anaerolineaceae bacterium]
MLRGRGNPNRKKSLDDHAETVESILHGLGVPIDSARMPDVDNGYGWHFKRGSAIIEIYTIEADAQGYFQVLSPIMHLPQTGLLPLYRRLLENNLQMTNASFGVFNDVVYVFNERPLQDLDPGEVEGIMTMVAGYADDFDNELVNEFGGRLYSQM